MMAQICFRLDWICENVGFVWIFDIQTKFLLLIGILQMTVIDDRFAPKIDLHAKLNRLPTS